MSKNVAVLGCGPTGLLVAYAVEDAGHVAHIISKKTKSAIPGSQHLHGPVPGLTSVYPEGTIQFVRLGTARGYAEKVYGDPERETGWVNYLQVYPSWNVIKAYDRLWEQFEDSVSDQEVTLSLIPDLIAEYDLVISTLPAQVLCKHDLHSFTGAPYYIEKLPTPPADEEHEIVVYNGMLTDPWYRWSILGGLCSREFTNIPDNGYLEGSLWTRGYKAVENDCTCWPEIPRCGRWAEWRHGVTMFKAYEKATRLMKELR